MLDDQIVSIRHIYFNPLLTNLWQHPPQLHIISCRSNQGHSNYLFCFKIQTISLILCQPFSSIKKSYVQHFPLARYYSCNLLMKISQISHCCILKYNIKILFINSHYFTEFLLHTIRTKLYIYALIAFQ